ncbi:MAG: oxidoreductase [archaeon]
MFNLKNKIIIITGGLGLIGSAFVKSCVEQEANVVVLDIDNTRGKTLTQKNSKVSFEKCDITDEKQVKKVIEKIVKKFKRIDALVNNAYPKNKNYGRKFEDVTFKDFCQNMSMHLGGYFLMTKEVSKVMKRQKKGTIINMGSIYGFSAPDFNIYKGTKMTMPVEYAAIKGGVINLTKYLAAYLGEYNIRVNSISPGGVENKQPKSFVKKYVEKVLIEKRMVKKEDLIGALIFLLSDEASYVTGQNIVVDGGWSL